MGGGKGGTVGLAWLPAFLSFASFASFGSFAALPGCGPAADTVESELCAESACDNGDCATGGQQMLREGLRRRCKKPKGIDAGAPGGASGMMQDTAVFPCAICARADNCCKAQGLAGCSYTQACNSARTTDETAFYSVLCRAVVESGPTPGGGACGSR
jgi:hypothetical protein